MEKALVVVPTYNEKENIVALLTEIFDGFDRSELAGSLALHVLVVDDGSPDGTAGAVRTLLTQIPAGRLHLLERTSKDGLGRAYLAGFAWALQRDYDWIVEMDADFSHRPLDLLKILEARGSGDFLIGSRYVAGGGTRNWEWTRKLISRGGSFYSRMILGLPFKDWTGGFNAWNRKVLQSISLESIRSDGYSFQIELKYRAAKAGFRGVEVPIMFEERRLGESKMSSKIVFEAMMRVWEMRLK